MNASPITSWEGATTYFTFADSPTIVGICLAGAVLIVGFFFVNLMKHELASFNKHKK